MTTAIRPRIRGVVTAKDFHALIQIERASSGNPWTLQEFGAAKKKLKGCATVVNAAKGELSIPLGFIFWDCKYRIHNMAVDPAYRFLGLGRFLLSHVEGLAKKNKVRRVSALITEEGLDAQLFLRACDYTCDDFKNGVLQFRKDLRYAFLNNRIAKYYADTSDNHSGAS